MTFDFDEPLDRRASGAEKWDEAILERVFGRKDVLPLWVADMDFRSPPEAVRALLECASAGEFGYRATPRELTRAVANWFRTRHGWGMDPNHLVPTPGVMTGVAAGIQLLSEPGDGVIVQPPVFFEFDTYIRRNHREVIENPLRLRDGRYEMDFEDLGRKAARPGTTLLVLCNPHNPVGRAWLPGEIAALSEICKEHGVRVVSDEIHSDLVYPSAFYSPAAVADHAAITCLSPAKTFNVGGVTGGFAHIPDHALRERFVALLRTLGLMKPNAVANEISLAVYREGGAWLDAAMHYLAKNVDYVRDRVSAIPGVILVEPDATFLPWLDLRGTGSDVRELLVERARLGLNPGEQFGTGGAGFARMCIACPRSILAEAFDRLEAAVA